MTKPSSRAAANKSSNGSIATTAAKRPRASKATMLVPTTNEERPPWTFLTNHSHVLIALARNGELRQRDLAQLVGVTSGAVQRILDDLEQGGYLKRERVGRRNIYQVRANSPLRHPLESNHTVDEVVNLLAF